MVQSFGETLYLKSFPTIKSYRFMGLKDLKNSGEVGGSSSDCKMIDNWRTDLLIFRDSPPCQVMYRSSTVVRDMAVTSNQILTPFTTEPEIIYGIALNFCKVMSKRTDPGTVV